MVVVMSAIRLLGTIAYALTCWAVNLSLAAGVVLGLAWVLFCWRM